MFGHKVYLNKRNHNRMTGTVPFFDYPHLFTSDENALIEIIRDVGRRGAFILQKDLEIFEQNLAAYTGAKYAVGVGNATDGLQIALMAGGLNSGDEVIICSHTMAATAGAVHFAGGVPVPVDPGADHLMDPQAVEDAITDRTKAVLPTQLNGRTANMDAIRRIAEIHGLLVFEDAAQALGSRFKGKCAGTFGVASCISFYPAKVLGCLGDGGAVLTNDDDVYARILQLRDHGRNRDGEIVRWGMNSRLDNMQAAILNHGLENYPRIIDRRRHLAGLYSEKLADVPRLDLPPAPGSDEEHFDVFQNFELQADRRDALKSYLSDCGIGTLIQWGGEAIYQLKNLGFRQLLPHTDRLFQRFLMLPLNMSMSDRDVEHVCDSIIEFYSSGESQ